MGKVASITHPGKRRRKNEDAVLVKDCGEVLLLVVADGVGGERGGEVASTEAIRTIGKRFGAKRHLPDPLGTLTAAIVEANRVVFERGQADRRVRGMATTVVAAVVVSEKAWVANVGDSRAYIVGADGIEQTTKDHSLVAEGIEEGSLTEDEARNSRARHVITRSVGTIPEIEVDVFGPLGLAPDSILLLCSDGLTDAVDDTSIMDIVRSGRGVDEVARALVDAANTNGGPDNISVVLYRP